MDALLPRLSASRLPTHRDVVYVAHQPGAVLLVQLFDLELQLGVLLLRLFPGAHRGLGEKVQTDISVTTFHIHSVAAKRWSRSPGSAQVVPAGPPGWLYCPPGAPHPSPP